MGMPQQAIPCFTLLFHKKSTTSLYDRWRGIVQPLIREKRSRDTCRTQKHCVHPEGCVLTLVAALRRCVAVLTHWPFTANSLTCPVLIDHTHRPEDSHKSGLLRWPEPFTIFRQHGGGWPDRRQSIAGRRVNAKRMR